ncbi:MAG: hypothetical protein GXW99_07990 [Clostridiales bacterium]|nr:hypothetical protein [Clostridiales bacterium]
MKASKRTGLILLVGAMLILGCIATALMCLSSGGQAQMTWSVVVLVSIVVYAVCIGFMNKNA